uniref:Uncharacterized protein n=1 Tax=Arundo donax TaxID=35708 RepID=A0A0A9A0I8_ARUDO
MGLINLSGGIVWQWNAVLQLLLLNQLLFSFLGHLKTIRHPSYTPLLRALNFVKLSAR